eukprot:GHVT01082812.1.p1 GENE.GHVT01082812.1~~GHVT01082812.1.p1  ORF type:complete len:1116 (+),score=124.47 GHVT01082812.1:344-3691(+)
MLSRGFHCLELGGASVQRKKGRRRLFAHRRICGGGCASLDLRRRGSNVLAVAKAVSGMAVGSTGATLARSWKYLAEGNAHVVYSQTERSACAPPIVLKLSKRALSPSRAYAHRVFAQALAPAVCTLAKDAHGNRRLRAPMVKVQFPCTKSSRAKGRRGWDNPRGAPTYQKIPSKDTDARQRQNLIKTSNGAEAVVRQHLIPVGDSFHNQSTPLGSRKVGALSAPSVGVRLGRRMAELCRTERRLGETVASATKSCTYAAERPHLRPARLLVYLFPLAFTPCRYDLNADARLAAALLLKAGEAARATRTVCRSVCLASIPIRAPRSEQPSVEFNPVLPFVPTACTAFFRAVQPFAPPRPSRATGVASAGYPEGRAVQHHWEHPHHVMACRVAWVEEDLVTPPSGVVGFFPLIVAETTKGPAITETCMRKGKTVSLPTHTGTARSEPTVSACMTRHCRLPGSRRSYGTDRSGSEGSMWYSSSGRHSLRRSSAGVAHAWGGQCNEAGGVDFGAATAEPPHSECPTPGSHEWIGRRLASYTDDVPIGRSRSNRQNDLVNRQPSRVGRLRPGGQRRLSASGGGASQMLGRPSSGCRRLCVCQWSRGYMVESGAISRPRIFRADERADALVACGDSMQACGACHLGGPQYLTIEVKPKSGVAVRRGLPCRFVMQQHDKVRRRLVARLSRYDPERLFFAPDIATLSSEVCHLLHTPQNNIRLFDGGRSVNLLAATLSPGAATNSLLHLKRNSLAPPRGGVGSTCGFSAPRCRSAEGGAATSIHGAVGVKRDLRLSSRASITRSSDALDRRLLRGVGRPSECPSNRYQATPGDDACPGRLLETRDSVASCRKLVHRVLPTLLKLQRRLLWQVASLQAYAAGQQALGWRIFSALTQAQPHLLLDDPHAAIEGVQRFERRFSRTAAGGILLVALPSSSVRSFRMASRRVAPGVSAVRRAIQVKRLTHALEGKTILRRLLVDSGDASTCRRALDWVLRFCIGRSFMDISLMINLVISSPRCQHALGPMVPSIDSGLLARDGFFRSPALCRAAAGDISRPASMPEVWARMRMIDVDWKSPYLIPKWHAHFKDILRSYRQARTAVSQSLLTPASLFDGAWPSSLDCTH